MNDRTYQCTVNGSCMGSVVALALSWVTHHSIGWALLHALCSWFYVAYWVIKHL